MRTKLTRHLIVAGCAISLALSACALPATAPGEPVATSVPKSVTPIPASATPILVTTTPVPATRTLALPTPAAAMTTVAPLPPEVADQMNSVFTNIVYVVLDAQYLSFAASGAQAGKLTASQEISRTEFVYGFMQLLDYSMARATVPDELKSAWDQAVSAHKQTKSVLQGWLAKEMGAGDVATAIDALMPNLLSAQDTAATRLQAAGLDPKPIVDRATGLYKDMYYAADQPLPTPSPSRTPIPTSTVRHRQLTAQPPYGNCVAFSPNGKVLALGCGMKTDLWDVASGQPLGQPLAQSGTLSWVTVFSPDSKTLAIGGDDGLGLWDVATGQQLVELVSHADDSHRVLSLAFSPDGQLLAWGDGLGNIRLWNIAQRQEIRSIFTGKKGYPVVSLSFSPDGKALAAAGWSVTLWDVATGKSVGALDTTADGLAVKVAYSPSGKTLATGQAGNISFWIVATGQRLCRTNDYFVHDFAFSPDGLTLASVDGMGHDITLWDVGNCQTRGEPLVEPEAQDRGGLTSVTYSPDGKTLATGTYGLITLWDATLFPSPSLMGTATPMPIVTLTPGFTPAPTFTPAPNITSTLVPLAQLDLAPLLIQAGDLPSGYTGAPMTHVVLGAFRGVPDPDQFTDQRFEENGKVTGGVSVLLYEVMDKVATAYKFVVERELGSNSVAFPGLGEGAQVSESDWTSVGGDKSAAIAFVRCHAIVSVLMTGENANKTVVGNYALRLDSRLKPIICR
jgi:WD40 repeat protein